MNENPRPVAIAVRNITKSYGSKAVLKNVSIEVTSGESLIILGPNGAGKTTLLKIMATILRASSGELLIDGMNSQKEPEKVRRKIGAVMHDVFFYPNLTACENLEFYCRLYDVPSAQLRVKEVVEMVGLTARMHDRVGIFSRGMQQRLSIARALLHNPSIMLLDEPDTGLDQEALEKLWKDIKGQEGNRTIIAATHSLDRAYALGSRFLILNAGKLVREIKQEELDKAKLARIYHDSAGVVQ
ncbi:MAG TPA: ABC transporter ATP-binding protein [Dehalococcoidales bacterium]|nr:ABC transporter ATP-binding protein [Dehalococcoidales bacterium]